MALLERSMKMVEALKNQSRNRLAHSHAPLSATVSPFSDLTFRPFRLIKKKKRKFIVIPLVKAYLWTE
jgi:hypothetical protein